MSNSSDQIAVRTVLFVCTANISRSPYAERLARHVTRGGGVRFASAGIPGTQDRAMDPQVLGELDRRGVSDGGEHRSRPIDADAVAGSDLVVTMEFRQHMRVVEGWPEATDRVFGLRQLAEAVRAAGPGGNFRSAAVTDSMTWDIADPYGQGPRAAGRCAEQIEQLLGVVLPALTGMPTEFHLMTVAPNRPRRWWRR